jgi:hypothetical protein
VTSGRLRTPLVEMCREMGMRSFKVTNPVDLMGIRSTTEEGEMERLLAENPVHYTADGYGDDGGGVQECFPGREGGETPDGGHGGAGGEGTQNGCSTLCLDRKAGEEGGQRVDRAQGRPRTSQGQRRTRS